MDEPGANEDDLVSQLALLGQALGNATRVRIAAVFLRRDEASPTEVATLIGDKLGNVAYHFRYLQSLGFLQLRRTVPRRGALMHLYTVAPPLRHLLPAAVRALGKDVALESADEAVGLDVSYGLVRLGAEEVIDTHGRAITRVARALANGTRLEILGYLLRRQPTTARRVAMGMDTPEPVVLEHIQELACGLVVRPAGVPSDCWIVPPATRQALVALKEVAEPGPLPPTCAE